jgi:putative Holliday junction resolvase
VTRVLGLDIGDRRIGFAFGNVMAVGNSMVLPGGFLQVKGDSDAVKKVCDLAAEEGADTLVVGLPLINNADNAQSKKIRALAAKISEALPGLPMHFWDEGLTSFSASRALAGAELKHSGKSKRGRVDAVAASLILQGFMDSRRTWAPEA